MLNTAHHAGYATHINEMISAFRKLGHEVLPVIMGGTQVSETLDGARENKIKVIAKNIIPEFIWESLKDIQLLRFDKYAKIILEQNVKKFKPDFIYERANYMQLSGVQVAQKYGIKHTLEVNSPYVEERLSLQGRSLFSKKAENFEKKQLMQSNNIIVVSSALKRYFIERHNISPEKFEVIPNAVNLESVTVNNAKISDLKKKYKSQGEFIIGFVGSFFKWHGIDILIKAFDTIEKDFNSCRLMIIGGGNLESKLKELAQSISPEKIIFTGKVARDEIYNYIDLFDIAVMANSNWYGSPVKIFEYGIMKKAIIAPDYAPLQDVINSGTDGILINPSIENLSSAIKKLISDKQLREKLAKNFYNKILNNYLWVINAERVLSGI